MEITNPEPEPELEKVEEQIKTNSRKRITLEKILPDSRLTKFSNHLEVLKSYVIASNNGKKALKYTDFKGLVSFNEQKVSGTNKFLEYLQLIESVKGQPGFYLPTKNLIEFEKFVQWGDETSAKSIMQQTLTQTWFYESVKNMLLIKGKVTVEELVQKLGLDSGADKELHSTSLKVLVDYLEYAELIQKNDDVFILNNSDIILKSMSLGASMPSEETKTNPTTDQIMSSTVNDMVKEEVIGTYSLKNLPSINIHIHIPHEITDERLESILRKVKESFSK